MTTAILRNQAREAEQELRFEADAKLYRQQRARCNELEELDVETLAAMVVELEAKGFWRCKCGVEAMPLTDNTICRCADLYDEEWHFIPGARSK